VAPAFPEPGDVVTIYGQADLTAYSKAERYGAAQGEKLAVKNPSSKRVAPAFPEPGDVVTIYGQTDRTGYCKDERCGAAGGEKI